MEKILILVGRYLPKPSANSICIRNVISAMPKDKYDITCICYDAGSFDNSGSEKIITISKGLLQSFQYKLEEKKSIIAVLGQKVTAMLLKLKQIPFLLTWPWTDPIYTYRVYRKAEQLHQADRFDAVVAVHMPLSSIIVGHKLKVKYPELKFIPYFLDSLSGGRPIRIMSTGWNTQKKIWWERKLLANADKIVVMESSREHHMKYNIESPFFSKLVYLDIPLLLPQKVSATEQKKSDTINVLFCGTANYPMRNLKFFFEVLSFLQDEHICFTFIGASNYKPLTETILPNVRYIPYITHDLLEKYYEQADVLINFGVTTPSAISGKIFEYMSYGKPIISTFSIDNEACLPYLKRYPLSFLVDERTTDIEIVAKKLKEFLLDNYQKHVDIDFLKDNFSKNTPVAFLNNVFG